MHRFDISLKMYCLVIVINGISTHVVYSIDERVVTAVAHCQPVATEEHDVDVTKPKTTL